MNRVDTSLAIALDSMGFVVSNNFLIFWEIYYVHET